MDKSTFSGYTLNHSTNPETDAKNLEKLVADSVLIIKAIEGVCPDALIADYELNREGFLTIRVIPNPEITEAVSGL